jgi:hypothetical protein
MKVEVNLTTKIFLQFLQQFVGNKKCAAAFLHIYIESTPLHSLLEYNVFSNSHCILKLTKSSIKQH